MNVLFGLLFVFVRADIPSACDATVEMNGTWVFYIGPGVDRMFNCSSLDINDDVKKSFSENLIVNVTIEADQSHTVYLNNALVGRWSPNDLEGFDVFINDLHFQAYFQFSEGIDGNNKRCYSTNCSQTMGGWVRTDVIHPDDFRCFFGEKLNGPPPVKGSCNVYARTEEEMYVNTQFRLGRKYKKPFKVEPSKFSHSTKRALIPDELDWSNYTGRNYVNPVYDQRSCGSCFAFGTLSALEARILIASSGMLDVSLSQQDIVSCSHYSQGCQGGYETEVGYWVMDHGIVDSKCFPYASPFAAPDGPAPQGSCRYKCDVSDATSTNANRLIFAANVSYIGGHYGACSEELMLEALQDGPIPVGIAAGAKEFSNPKPGTIIDSTYNGGLDHTVLLVGYGTENGKKWWKIKNSWGPEWGDVGFARIRRGNNTIGIESDATVIFPVPFRSTVIGSNAAI